MKGICEDENRDTTRISITSGWKDYQADQGHLREKHILTSKEDLICYGYDATNLEGPVDLVVFPGTAEEVSEILKLANKHLFPVVPRGMGTGFTGGSVPAQGGVVLVMTRIQSDP